MERIATYLAIKYKGVAEFYHQEFIVVPDREALEQMDLSSARFKDLDSLAKSAKIRKSEPFD